MDLLSAVAGVVAEVVSGGPLGLLFMAVEALFILAEWAAAPAANRCEARRVDPSLN